MAKMSFDCITKQEVGPYPAHAGDYCSNEHESEFKNSRLDRGFKARFTNSRPSNVRRGNPRACAGKSLAELKAEGWFGLYLIADTKLMPWERAIPSPEELREPKS